MTTPLRVVLVGAGNRSRKLYARWLSGEASFRDTPARAIAVVDSDRLAAAELAADLPGAAIALARDLGSVLRENRPDLVIVATPDSSHRRYAEVALHADTPTLLEKPLATTVADAHTLVEAATGAPLLVANNLRFVNLHAFIRNLLATGEIGRIVDAEFHYTLTESHTRSYFTRWHRTRRASGGLEITKACHHIDLLCWWLGATPGAVTATLGRRHYRPGENGIPSDADIHDHIRADLEFGNGTYVRYSLSGNTSHDGYQCVLRGEVGTCAIDYRVHAEPHRVTVQYPHHTSTFNIPRQAGSHAGGDQRMIQALPLALSTPRATAFATADQAAVAVAVGAGIYASHRDGRRILLPEPPTIRS